jgi:FkbM family methyltransferase
MMRRNLNRQVRTRRMTILDVHRNLSLKYGSFKDEFPEQVMALKYLTGTEKVLEIGGNIGRNSLIIGFLLKSAGNDNFVTLECDKTISEQLTENRNLNGMNFHVECAALSKKKLIQQGWTTMPSDTVPDGWKSVPIINFEELTQKYNIAFDTLVLDCEGAFYYILQDMPEVLTNIKLIIMENDYTDITHKEYIDKELKKNNFTRDYVKSGGWGPCYSKFYEVWKKTF